MRRLVRETLLPRKLIFFFAILFMAIGAISTAAVAWLTRTIVNSIFLTGDQIAIVFVSLAIAAMFFLRGISEYFTQVTLGRIRASIASELQIKQYNHTVRRRMGDIRAQSAAKIAAQINWCSSAAANAVLLISTNLVKNLLTLILLGAVMIYQQPVLSLAAVIVGPIALIFLQRLNQRIHNLAKDENALEGGVIATVTEAVSGAAIIKSFQAERFATQSVSRSAKQREKRFNEINLIMARTSPIMETIGGLIIVLVILYSGSKTVAGSSQTPGELVSFITAFMLAYAPAKKLSAFNLQLTRLFKPISSMYNSMDNDVTEEVEYQAENSQNRLSLSENSGLGIVFENVSFSYVKGSPALIDVSFDIKPGENIALVGRSGSGKTTIVNLLLGFERASSGTIRINGIPIDEIPLAELRRNITLVTQDTFLFEDTIRNNIVLGDENATDEKVAQVAEAARVMEFARELPLGLETEIGSLGTSLSGGQRQRVAIARAMLRSAPIVIWDEATSALDGNTETEINVHSKEMFQERTQLSISHRPRTAESADRVIFLEKGHVKSVATHKKLLSTDPAYKQLWG